MRLLFDEQLSEARCPMRADLYPDFLHVRVLGHGGDADTDVWNLAREHNCLLVTRDEDFHRPTSIDATGAPNTHLVTHDFESLRFPVESAIMRTAGSPSTCVHPDARRRMRKAIVGALAPSRPASNGARSVWRHASRSRVAVGRCTTIRRIETTTCAPSLKSHALSL
ncbi:MAG: DUF5615 family PIN-like protein [Vicinamibacterales bacterium]